MAKLKENSKIVKVSGEELIATEPKVLSMIQANAYVHPDKHPASIITQDANHRFVTDAQILLWNEGGSSNLELGETSTTAYRGDRGKVAYDHSQTAHAPTNAWVYNENTIKAVKVNNAVNADTISGFTVGKSVPANAKFTDTVYSHPSSHPWSILTSVPATASRWPTYAEVTGKPSSFPAHYS